MIGQISLFPPDESLPLKDRVKVFIVDPKESAKELAFYGHKVKSKTRCLYYAVEVDGAVTGLIHIAPPVSKVKINGIGPERRVAVHFAYNGDEEVLAIAFWRISNAVGKNWAEYHPTSKPIQQLECTTDRGSALEYSCLRAGMKEAPDVKRKNGIVKLYRDVKQFATTSDALIGT